MQLRPQLNWPYAIIVIAIAFLGLGFIVVMGWLRPFGDLSPTQNVWAQLFVDALCLWAFLGLLNQTRTNLSLVLDDDQVSQATLFGAKTLRWIEVREIRTVAYGIHLHGDHTRIVLAPYAYADPQAFVAEIARHVKHLL